MGTALSLRGWRLTAALISMMSLMSACGSGTHSRVARVEVDDGSPRGAPGPAMGTGTLTVEATDPDGQPIAGASVGVFNIGQTETVGTAQTSAAGMATIESVPAEVIVYVSHEFGGYRNTAVEVSQDKDTFLQATLEPSRPQPTVALLPVSIPAESVNVDRSALTLEVEIVASASAPFMLAEFGEFFSVTTPYLGLELGPPDSFGRQRQCSVWLDRIRVLPTCGDPWGEESPYTVAVLTFDYDPVGHVPVLAEPSPAKSAMLVLDQSERVIALDPAVRRSFAARRLIERAVDSSVPESLSVAGLAGDGGSLPSSFSERPLWVPLGAGTVYSSDRLALEAAVAALEPLLGGSAPVFDGLHAALALAGDYAPPGNRALIALLGGGDDGGYSDSAKQAALSSLREQRDDTDVQTIVIAAADAAQASERARLADLAAALRAPTVSLGDRQSWGSGVYAALDLAADLIDGSPLPTLSVVFSVSASQPGAFMAGATLYGVVYLESHTCPMGCWEVPVEFAATVP